jgi:peptidoglycan/LPS O-acetylase OafA/YrhL
LLFWSEAGYFDAEAIRKPLLHLWSLGVEEQFYLFWPMLLLGLRKLPARYLKMALLALSVASFLLNVSQVYALGDSVAAFYSPVTRLWELAAGGLLAIHWSDATPDYCKLASIRP